MHLLIVEDEPLAAKRLYGLIVELNLDFSKVSYCDSIESAVKFFQQFPAPDLAFMDIELADGRSFAIFDQVEVRCPVIFTTAYDEHALEAFKVNSIDYLLKPIDAKELHHAVEKWKTYHLKPNLDGELARFNQLMQRLQINQEYRSRIVVSKSDSLIPIDIQDVAWIFAEDKLNFIGTFNRDVYPINQSLDELQRELNPMHFHRANRSLIVHRKSIVKASFHFNGKLKLHLNPDPEMEVFVSRERAQAFKTWLGA